MAPPKKPGGVVFGSKPMRPGHWHGNRVKVSPPPPKQPAVKLQAHHHHHKSKLVAHAVGSRLHVGCGKRRLHGWINADAVPGVGDVVLDLHSPTALVAGTYREIYACHVLEHCWPQETPSILRRMHDALLPGGTLRLSVPDLRLVVKNCVDSNAYGDERSALSVLYGGEFSKDTSSPDLHRQAFWRERLERLLVEAGFKNVREWKRGQYPAIDQIKDYATWPMDREGKSTISLNLEADRAGELSTLSFSPAVATAPGSLIDVSVLLGTVNRPDMLRDCVEAVRASVRNVPIEIAYEIVVAYGSDDDLSLSWLREQSDVTLVRGGMIGAIEAFNRAYAVSRGRLICQINDDVIVEGDSIARAIAHLDNHPDSAGVVFKFLRREEEEKGYHHERVAGALHPNQMVARRETCEAVVERIGAFWGDEAHRSDKTYGGDTAFGVVCAHLGLRLDSVEGVQCHDLLAADDLRDRNKIPALEEHGQRWIALYKSFMDAPAQPPRLDEWPHAYVPRRGMAPRRSPVEAGRPLRFMAMPIVSKDWPQTAMRAAMAKVGPYAEHAHSGKLTELDFRTAIDVACKHRPDVVWVQVQCDGWRDFALELRKAAGPDCTLLSWNGDVRTDQHEQVESWICALRGAFDIVTFDNVGYAKKLAAEGIVAGYLSLGHEGEIEWEPSAQETESGACFVGTNYSHLDGGARQNLFRTLNEHLPGMVTLYGGGWKNLQSRGPVHYVDGARIVRRTPVTICASLFSDLERYTSNRLKTTLAAGGVAAVKRFSDMEGLGLVDGVNCLVWDAPDDLVPLLRDWTRPERAGARLEIRHRARELAARRHTWDCSVQELLAIVRDHRARKGLT